MRTNGQSDINASELRPDHLDLTGRKKIVCRHCRRWSFYKKHMVFPHDDQGEPCPGSGQRVWLDLTPGEWARRYMEAAAQTDLLRPADGKARHRNPYGGISEPPALPGEVNPDPPVNGRGEALLPSCSRM